MTTITLTQDELIELVTWSESMVGDYVDNESEQLAHSLRARLFEALEQTYQPQ